MKRSGEHTGEPARPFRENPRLPLGPGTAVSYFPLECSSFREEAADGKGVRVGAASRRRACPAEWKHLGPPVCPVAADRNGQNCEDSAGARSAEPRPLPRPFAAPPPLPVRAPPRGRSLLPPLECRLSQDNRKKQVILLCRPPLRAQFFLGGGRVFMSPYSLSGSVLFRVSFFRKPPRLSL